MSAADQYSWYRDAAVRRFIAVRYLPWLASLSLAWEIAHLPLYTLWDEASLSYMAFAITHCTAGDVLIGGTCLAVTLSTTRQGTLGAWQWERIALGTALLGVAYTGFSEWLNVHVFQSWMYSERMPVIGVAGVRLGVSPLLQWVLIP